MKRLLILVPTDFEAQFLRPLLQSELANSDSAFEICGFGPVTSGIRTSQLIAQHRPAHCLLLGIAGSFCPELRIGSAMSFNQISCYGIGVGSGSEHVGALEMGWQLWPELRQTNCAAMPLILDEGHSSDNLHLLTVCSAAVTADDALERKKRFPGVDAEDMEAYSVGLACLSSETRLTVVRGISNRVGERDKSQWDIPAALSSVAIYAAGLIKSASL